MSNTDLRSATKKSYNWFRKNVSKALGTAIDEVGNRWVYSRLPGADRTLKNAINSAKAPLVGNLYFYIYDPKWKQTLPYYDVFPLVIPIGYKKNGFLGLNFHYLPPVLRAQLLDGLLSFKAYTDYLGKPDQYVRISYDLLKGLPLPYQPTIKHYIWTHVKSNFARVDFDEWENAVFLPAEQFKKADKRTVWKDSREMVK